MYVYGTTFTVVTDHAALKWLLNLTNPDGRLARWAVSVQSFNSKIVHRSGRKHSNADALSRPIMNINSSADRNDGEEDEDNISSSSLDHYEDALLLFYLKNGRFEPGSSENQRKRIIKISKKYKLDKDTLLYAKNEQDEFKIIPRKDYLINICHVLGHFGIQETYKRVNKKYYWRNMIKDI